MKQKTKFTALSVACIGCMAASGTLAAYDSTVSVVNNLSMDTVDISLSEYSIDDGREVPYQNKYDDLAPGAVISKIPRITNLGADCYVRAKVELATTPAEGKTNYQVLTMDDISGMDTSKWTYKEDGYYYYNSILSVPDKADLFNSVTIPSSWEKPNENCKYQIDITVEAVQSEHFTPAMDTSNPWGNTEIQECKRTRDFRNLSNGADNQFVMSYSDGTKDLIVNNKDLFSNFASMVPGDVSSDTLDIENRGNSDIELFFSTGYFNDYELPEDAELLKQIGLKIDVVSSEGRKNVYTGDLMSESLSKAISLGTFEAGFKGQLEFTLSIPESLDNAFNMTQTKVQWNFGLNDLGTGIPNKPTSGGNTNNPHTGSVARKISSGLLAMASLGCLFSLGKVKRKKENKDEKQ